MRCRSSLATATILLALSCSSSDDRPAVSESANELLFASTDYELQPGEEKYMCWAANLPADRDAIVRKISGDYGPATHHVFFAYTLAPEQEGMTECPVLFKTTWVPIYLGGKNTSPLEMPEGAAIDLGRGKQLVLQLHLQNTTSEPLKNKVTMHLELGDEGKSYTPAGVFGFDNRVIQLPAGADDVQTDMSCAPGKDMEVFAVLGHMHKLGKSLQVSQNDRVVYEESWKFDEQPITPFELSVKASDEIGLSCRHRNASNQVITYGESSDTEMCAAIFYYTPYDRLDGCVNAPQEGDAGAPDGDGGVRVIGDGACTNEADLSIAGGSALGSAMSDCGASCLGEPATCASSCLETGSGLGPACATCYGELLTCITGKCLAQCAAGPGGAACSECRAAQCTPAFEACSGLAG